MKSKEWYEGFVAGVAFSAAREKSERMDAYDIVKASLIPLKDFKKYAAEEDLKDINIDDCF